MQPFVAYKGTLGSEFTYSLSHKDYLYFGQA